MKTTWKPLVAGILDIMIGVLNVIGMFAIIMFIAAVGGGLLAMGRMAEIIPIWMSDIGQGIVVIIAIAAGILGVLPLLGGIQAVQRKSWHLALLGSIVAILTLAPLGITATILVLLSDDEFE